jgi:hypothetical protein
MTILGLDVSNYSDVPTTDQVARLKALGMEFAIVGSSYGNAWWEQEQAFRAGGFITEEYQFPDALRGMVNKQPWWADAENGQATRATLRDAIANGSEGPYSRKGFADANFPDWNCVAEFPEARLWDARYVHAADAPCLIMDAVASGGDVAAAIAAELAQLSPFVPYWGFTQAAVTQWHDSVTIEINMDLNVREDIDVPLNDQDRKDIADIVKAELVLLPDQTKQIVDAVMNLRLEEFRQELEKAGQLPPRTAGS